MLLSKRQWRALPDKPFNPDVDGKLPLENLGCPLDRDQLFSNYLLDLGYMLPECISALLRSSKPYIANQSNIPQAYRAIIQTSYKPIAHTPKAMSIEHHNPYLTNYD